MNPSRKQTPSDALLLVLKRFDAVLSTAGDEAFAAAVAAADGLREFAMLIAGVQNVLADLHMFLLRRMAESRRCEFDRELVSVLSERFNRMTRDKIDGVSLRRDLERSSREVLDLLLCLDAATLASLPPDTRSVPEYLLRTLAVERDLAWLQEFHLIPQLAKSAHAE